MLEITLNKAGSRAIPVVICDQCKERIIGAHEGIYMWTNTPSPAGPLYFFHVGACNRIYEAEHPGRWAWCSLSALPKQLAHTWGLKDGV